MFPDFTHTSQKKVIEAFGNYWHQGEDPEVRIGKYKNCGFQCLVIWENELSNNSALSKIIGFTRDTP